MPTNKKAVFRNLDSFSRTDMTKGQFQPKADWACLPRHRFSQKTNDRRLTLLRNYSSRQKRKAIHLFFQENLRRANLPMVLTPSLP